MNHFIQITRLSDMMHIVNGHLCKSNPFDAANVGLKVKGAVDIFHGNMAVNISGKSGRPRNTHIRIPPPQPTVSTIFKTVDNSSGLVGQACLHTIL